MKKWLYTTETYILIKMILNEIVAALKCPCKSLCKRKKISLEVQKSIIWTFGALENHKKLTKTVDQCSYDMTILCFVMSLNANKDNFVLQKLWIGNSLHVSNTIQILSIIFHSGW